MSDNTPNIQTGRKVLFVGGPEAGNVRMVPESHGDHVKAESEYIYRIWPFRMAGVTAANTMFLAYAADQHPMNMLVEMWREYSPVAQIKRNDPSIAQTYQTLGGK